MAATQLPHRTGQDFPDNFFSNALSEVEVEEEGEIHVPDNDVAFSEYILVSAEFYEVYVCG